MWSMQSRASLVLPAALSLFLVFGLLLSVVFHQVMSLIRLHSSVGAGQYRTLPSLKDPASQQRTGKHVTSLTPHQRWRRFHTFNAYRRVLYKTQQHKRQNKTIASWIHWRASPSKNAEMCSCQIYFEATFKGKTIFLPLEARMFQFFSILKVLLVFNDIYFKFASHLHS